MEKDWSSILKEIVLKGVELAEKTGSFAIEQAPDLLQQFYRWHLVSNIIYFVCGIVILLLGRFAPNVWLEKKETGRYIHTFFNKHGDDGVITAYIVFTVCTIWSCYLLFNSIYDIIYLLVAPKIYLINYFIQ
mgnify:CR=1 FL=1